MTCRAIQARAKMASNLTISNHPHRPVSPAVDALDELMSNNTETKPSSHDVNSTLTADLTNTLTAELTKNETNAESSSSHKDAIRTSTPLPGVQKSRIRSSSLDPSQIESLGSDAPATPNQSTIINNSVPDLRNGIGSGTPSQTDSPQTFHSVTPDRPSDLTPEDTCDSGDLLASHNSGTQTEDGNLHEILKVPILGYEVMEERSRFTVFKVQVRKSDFDTWFIFRRYTDFVRLNDKLRELFPHFRLALPPKRWFGDNFDRSFLEDRLLGLQAFLNNVAGHKDVVKSSPVKRFFCLDDPPGPHDSLEESRALCESLEEQNYILQKEIEDKNTRISLLEEELSLQRKEVENLKKAIKFGRHERRRGSQQSELSINDTNALIEADQQRYANIDWSEVPVTRRSPVKERLYADHRLSLGNMSVGSMDIVPEEDKHSINSLPVETTDAQNNNQDLKSSTASTNSSKNSTPSTKTRSQNKTDAFKNSYPDSKSMTSSQSGDSIQILDHEFGESRQSKISVDLRSTDFLAQGDMGDNVLSNGSTKVPDCGKNQKEEIAKESELAS